MGEANRGMGTEDFSFSFPITPIHSPIDSPPLWTLSPAASPAYRIPRKRPSYLEAGGLINIRRLRFTGCESDNPEDDDNNNDEDREEEKMGMMWEAWNEELSKHRRQIMMDLHTSNSVFKLPKCANGNNVTANYAANTADESGNVMKTNIVKKKRSVLVVVKVLKKLFLLHQSASSKSSSKKGTRS